MFWNISLLNTQFKQVCELDIRAEHHLLQLNLLVFLWLYVDVSKNSDVWKVDPEFTE